MCWRAGPRCARRRWGRNGQVAQVLAGLEPGERVILHPGEAVADGVLITEH